MAKTNDCVIIRLQYRHVINAASENAFDQYIHDNTYQEFFLKSQAYNTSGSLRTFSAMKANDGRANSLHYKCGFAASGLIGLLAGKIPYLQNQAGGSLAFTDYHFELLESDLDEKERHAIAVYFTTPDLVLKHSFGDYLVLAEKSKAGEGSSATFTIRLQYGLSVCSYEKK